MRPDGIHYVNQGNAVLSADVEWATADLILLTPNPGGIQITSKVQQFDFFF